MTRNKIRKLGGIGRFADRGQRVFGNVLFDLGVFLEFLGHGTGQGANGRGIAGCFLKRGHVRLEIGIGRGEARDGYTAAAFDQHLDGAIGQLEQLQHIGQHAHAIDAIGIGIIHRRVDLRAEQDLFVILHHLFEGAHRFLAADEERHDHVGKHHDVAQRQNGKSILGHWLLPSLVLATGLCADLAAALTPSGKDALIWGARARVSTAAP